MCVGRRASRHEGTHTNKKANRSNFFWSAARMCDDVQVFGSITTRQRGAHRAGEERWRLRSSWLGWAGLPVGEGLQQ